MNKQHRYVGLAVLAGGMGMLAAATPAQPVQDARGSVDQIGASQPVGMDQVKPAVPAPVRQVSSVTERAPTSLQLTAERGSGPGSQQLTQGARTAQPSQALSTPKEGRTGTVERVAGDDRCDPAAPAKTRSANCVAVIETRAAEFSPRAAPPLSPEQRIIMDQQLRERTSGMASAVRRLANNGEDAQSPDAQGLASVVLREPVDPKREQPTDPAAAAASGQILAIVNAIIDRPVP